MLVGRAVPGEIRLETLLYSVEILEACRGTRPQLDQSCPTRAASRPLCRLDDDVDHAILAHSLARHAWRNLIRLDHVA